MLAASMVDLLNSTSIRIGRDDLELAGSLDRKPIQVIIAHEVRILHEGLTELLNQEPEVKIVAASPNGIGAASGQYYRADVVLLDAGVRMDSEALGNRIRRFSRKWPRVKVIVIGVADTASEIVGCIEAGASGYTLPSYSVKDLIKTIKMVHTGEASCPPDMLARLFERVTVLSRQAQSAQTELTNLTHRELEVLRLIGDGMSNKEISVRLNLELQTVKNYVHNLLQKLQVSNRQEAAAYMPKLPLPQML